MEYKLHTEELGLSGWGVVKGSEKSLGSVPLAGIFLGNEFLLGLHKYLELGQKSDGTVRMTIESSSRLRSEPLIRNSADLKPGENSTIIGDGFGRRHVLTKVD